MSREAVLRAFLGFGGLLSVGSLLAWAYRLGSFQAWFWAVTAPSVIFLAGAGVWLGRSGRFPGTRNRLISGAAGGLLGTLGYDLFRLPFVVAGLRLLAPIDSYGVLIAGTSSSSPVTSFAGWSYHFANGIGFGIFYGMVAAGRRWWWGVVWGLVLETATLITPFAGIYQIEGRWGLILIAYAAHVAYGYPLGRVVQRTEPFAARFLELTRRPLVWMFVVLVAGLAVWHRPFTSPDDVRAGERVAPGASALIVEGRFVPEWLRVAEHGCVLFRNEDERTYAIKEAIRSPRIRPRATSAGCFGSPGVYRVRTDERPYSGGFVIVDPALERSP